MRRQPDCDRCRKFTARVIRQHAFDRRKPTEILCQYCADDPAIPKQPEQNDYDIQEPEEVLHSTQSGYVMSPDPGGFTVVLREDNVTEKSE